MEELPLIRGGHRRGWGCTVRQAKYDCARGWKLDEAGLDRTSWIRTLPGTSMHGIQAHLLLRDTVEMIRGRIGISRLTGSGAL